MKIDYKNEVIYWQHNSIPMEDIRKEFIRQFPSLVGKHKVKVTDNLLVTDWRALFHTNNLYYILWKISLSKSKQNLKS